MTGRSRMSRTRLPNGTQPIALMACLIVLGLAGCDRLDMYVQPRYEPLEKSTFFADGLSARQPIVGTIARGQLREDVVYYTGKDGKQPTSQIPAAAYRALYDRAPQRFDRDFDDIDAVELRRTLLERGRERFEIYCSVCHGRTGDGDGIIVRRGFRKPPSYHSDRMRQAAAGHFFDVISNGFGAMASYASRIDVADRWAIVAYVRALQLSQQASADDVAVDQRQSLGINADNAAPERPTEVEQ